MSNFSGEVKRKAAEVFVGLGFRRYEIRKDERTVMHLASLDPADVLVMIRKYEQRIEWAYLNSVKREVEILRLKKKIAKLESRAEKKKPVQTELFPDGNAIANALDDAFADPGREAIEGASPRAEDIETNEPGEAIQSGDQETSV